MFGKAHPDGEFKVLVATGDSEYAAWEGDTWVFQIEGYCEVWLNGETNKTNAQQLLQGVGGIVPPNTRFRVTRGEGSVGFIIRNDPRGNKAGILAGGEGKKE